MCLSPLFTTRCKIVVMLLIVRHTQVVRIRPHVHVTNTLKILESHNQDVLQLEMQSTSRSYLYVISIVDIAYKSLHI